MLKTAVESWPVLCDVTARPSSTAPDRFGKVRLEPGIGVQVTPSVDVAALNVVPVLVICR